MVLRRIDPGPVPGANQTTPPSQSSQPTPSRALNGQLASLSATLRDVQDKVSRTPTDSKASTGPAPTEASYPESYTASYGDDASYHDDDPEVVGVGYRDIPQHDPPEYSAAPPVYNPSPNVVPKDDPRKRRFKRLAFFVCAFMLCVLLLVTQAASRSNSRSRYSQPIHHPPHPTPIYPTNLPPVPEPARSLTRHESSQSISGTYTLYDLIDFSTASGSISITVELSDADILNPRRNFSPTLKLSTKSGSINLHFNSSRFRNVQLNHTTILKTVSGSCSARIVHGLSTSVSTTSGSQNLNIYPSLSPHESYLTTTSQSGSQSIVVHDPEGAVGAKLNSLKARIQAMGSANLSVKYPRTWEGMVHASSAGSGTVNVQGSIERQEMGKREARGWRGMGAETELVGMGSGSINFRAA